MTMEKQKTISKKISLKGIGLHTGNKVEVTFCPAQQDTGIIFVRVDQPGSPEIKARGINLLPHSSSSPRCSSVGDGNLQIHTIEHLMASLAGLGIDNIRIEINNNEVPGMDGSSVCFLEALKKAGVKEQEKSRQYYAVKEPVFIQEPDAAIVILPSQELKVSYTLDYNNPLLKGKFFEFILRPDEFEKHISCARTFCLEEEIEDLKSKGFGKGANLDNTVVVGKEGVLNSSLRYEDEFVRHKILDLVGDLYLLGQPLKGHVIALKSGHFLNVKLLKKIEQQKERLSSAGMSTQYNVPSGMEMDVMEIKKILPHREPFLLVDRIISMEAGKKIVGVKNVTINDYFFKGHFPQRPVMPGVLMVEAMAQAGGVMMLAPEDNRGKIAYFMAINNVKFRKPVVPGDQLILEVEVVKMKSRTGQVRGQALVDGKVVAEADLMFVIADS